MTPTLVICELLEDQNQMTCILLSMRSDELIRFTFVFIGTVAVTESPPGQRLNIVDP